MIIMAQRMGEEATTGMKRMIPTKRRRRKTRKRTTNLIMKRIRQSAIGGPSMTTCQCHTIATAIEFRKDMGTAAKSYRIGRWKNRGTRRVKRLIRKIIE